MRELKPGAMFAGTDSRSSLLFRLIHIGDTNVMVAPVTLGARLERVGFMEVAVDANTRRFRYPVSLDDFDGARSIRTTR